MTEIPWPRAGARQPPAHHFPGSHTPWPLGTVWGGRFFLRKIWGEQENPNFKLQVNYVVSLIQLNLLACRMDGNGNCQHDTSWHEWRGVSTLAVIGCTSNIATHQHPDSTAIDSDQFTMSNQRNYKWRSSMKYETMGNFNSQGPKNHSSVHINCSARRSAPFFDAKSASALFPAVRCRRRTKMDKLTPAKFSS